MNLNKLSRVLGFAIFAVCVSGSAGAERLVASAGHAWIGSEAGCFTHDYGNVQNVCSDRRWWITGVRAITGSRTFRVYGTGSGSGHVTCEALVTDNTGAPKSWTGHVAPTNYSYPTPWPATTLGTLNVGAGDGVMFECLIRNTNELAHRQIIGTFEY